MAGDWIKLHRKLAEHPIMQHDGLCRLWVICLLRANWKETQWLMPGTLQVVQIPRGSFVTGRHSLHEAMYQKSDRRKSQNPTEHTVWRWLNSLAEMGCVELQSMHNRCTIVTVCNYDTYQSGENEVCTTNAQPAHNQCTTGAQPAHTEEEGKNIRRKEGKKKSDAAHPAPIPESLNTTAFCDAWNSFRQMRLEIKKPFKPTGEVATLKKLAKWGVDKAIVALEKSTENQWQGVFEPKPEDMPVVAESRVPTDEDLRNWRPD